MTARARPGFRARAGVLAAILVVAGCGTPVVDPQQALQAFRALTNGGDMTYRFELVVLSDGTVEGQGSVQAIGAVAGSDSAYRLTLEREQAGQPMSDLVISGDQAFRRTDNQPWEPTTRPEGFVGGDLATLLPLVGSTDLSVVGRVDFEGASHVQLSNVVPIPMQDGENQPVITRLDLLIADDGTPVRIVAEFDPGVPESNRTTVEFRLTDFGAEISIQPPVIP
jgi:hypothetical protein